MKLIVKEIPWTESGRPTEIDVETLRKKTTTYVKGLLFRIIFNAKEDKYWN